MNEPGEKTGLGVDSPSSMDLSASFFGVCNGWLTAETGDLVSKLSRILRSAAAPLIEHHPTGGRNDSFATFYATRSTLRGDLPVVLILHCVQKRNPRRSRTRAEHQGFLRSPPDPAVSLAGF